MTEAARASFAQGYARTLRDDRAIRWTAIDHALLDEVRRPPADGSDRWRRWLLVFPSLALFAPLIAAATLLGGRYGIFSPTVTVPLAAVLCAIGAVMDVWALRRLQRDPDFQRGPRNTLLVNAIATVVALILAVLRGVQAAMDPTVFVISIAVIAVAVACVVTTTVLRLRVPRRALADAFAVLRADPAAWQAVCADLEATLRVLVDKGRLTAAAAAHARALGPGRLSELDHG